MKVDINSDVPSSHLEKIMTIEGFCEMERTKEHQKYLFMIGRLRQPIVAGQHVCIADPGGHPICDTYISGITVGSDNYQKVHRQASAGEEVQMIVGTNYSQHPELKTSAKYLCSVIYDD